MRCTTVDAHTFVSLQRLWKIRHFLREGGLRILRLKLAGECLGLFFCSTQNTGQGLRQGGADARGSPAVSGFENKVHAVSVPGQTRAL